MDEQEFEAMLERLLNHDFSEGTEDFHDDLLSRCLAELKSVFGSADLADEDLELLAAAGDLNAEDPTHKNKESRIK